MDYSTEEQLNILLASAAGMTAKHYDGLIARFGSAREVFRQVSAGADAGIPPRLVQDIRRAGSREQLNKLADFLHASNSYAACMGSSLYPDCFAGIDQAPPVIFVQGDISLLARGGAAVIGSRHCTAYGRRTAAAMAKALAENGITVISGGARGIDTAALESALENGGKAIAVLGCGLDITYPNENAALFASVRRSGAVVSEFLPGTPPYPSNFPRRNRIVSALSDCVLVVEAGDRSGTLTTVRWAQEQGREIACIPGSIYSPQSEVPNRLIRDGARIITCEADLLGFFGKTAASAPRPVIKVSEQERQILAMLSPGEDFSLDEISQRCNNSAGQLASLLTMMELRGIILRGPGGLYSVNTQNEYQ